MFGRTTDGPFAPVAIGKRAKRSWTAAGLEAITFHECRHTFASLLIDSGANPKAVQEFMGHSKIQTTFDVYGHLFPGSRDEVRERMDAYLEARDDVLTGEPDWGTAPRGDNLSATGRATNRLSKPKTKRPALCGAPRGTGRRDICDVSVGGRPDAQAPAGTLNRVDAVSATMATPTPTKKTPGAHSPVAIPIASPEIPAVAAST